MAKNYKIVVLFLFLGVSYPTRANLSHLFLENDKIAISSTDQKKIDKADKEIQKSAEIMKEADKYYAELATKQAELTSEESDKLNNKALDKQIEALKMQMSGNYKKFDTYANIANEFWKRFHGNPEEFNYTKAMENEARNNYKSSQEQLNDAEGTKDKLLAYSKISTAAETLTKAVEGIKKALDNYLNTQLTPPPSSQTIPKNVQSNPSDSLSKLNNNQIPAADTLPKKNEQMPTVSDKQKEDYAKTNVQQQILPVSVETKPDTSTVKILASTLNADEDSKLSQNKIKNDEYQKRKETKEEISKKKISKINDSQRLKNLIYHESTKKDIQREKNSFEVGEVKGLIFKVQIAASRVPLNDIMLRDIYKGKETIEESLENEWYKYSINCGNNYNKACELIRSIYINGAFISIYRDNVRISSKDIFK